MPGRRELATSRLSWLAIILTCLAKIGILVPARGDCGLGGNLASKARHGGSRRGNRQPRVLLLDEPLSALDAKVRLQLREQIRTLQQRLGTTTLFVTHDQEEALSMADRVGVMSNGRLEQIAAPDALYTDPATAFVAEFVGVMNRIPGELQAGDQVTALGSTIPVRGHRPAQSAVDVLVRPEGLRLEVVENGNGIVTARTFLGSVTRVGVQLSGDVAVQVDRPSAESAALAPGASVAVSLPAQPVLVAGRRVS
jgi:putative spermidine/putrescine transport system ATP-binding protein